MYIDKLRVLKDYRNLDEGFQIDDLPAITLFVGDQGCGKSSLLNLLRDNEPQKISVSPTEKLMNMKEVKSFYFDTESMNPRMAPEHDYTNIDGSSKGVGIAGKLMSHFESHGETLREFTVNRITEAKNSVMLIDEPESALSIRNQYLLAKRIRLSTLNNDCQYFIATHCMPLIQSVHSVYDLHEKKWKTSKQFLTEQSDI